MADAQQNPFQPQQQKQHKGVVFKKEEKQLGIDAVQVSNELNNVSRRLRIMEERYINIRRKTQVTDQNMLLNNRRLRNEIKMVSDDVREIKRELLDIKTKMRLIIKELKECSRKEDVSVLQKYIELWEPINFVTRHEVENIINDILASKTFK